MADIFLTVPEYEDFYHSATLTYSFWGVEVTTALPEEFATYQLGEFFKNYVGLGGNLDSRIPIVVEDGVFSAVVGRDGFLKLRIPEKYQKLFGRWRNRLKRLAECAELHYDYKAEDK